MRTVLATVILLTATAEAQRTGGEVECRLDAQGIPHCSTPTSRANAATQAVVNSVAGYDVDARMEYIRLAMVKWTKRTRECREGFNTDLSAIFSAYNHPGSDDGHDIEELNEQCAREFAAWLYKAENGRAPKGFKHRVATRSKTILTKGGYFRCHDLDDTTYQCDPDYQCGDNDEVYGSRSTCEAYMKTYEVEAANKYERSAPRASRK
jgi:hypothetical protein